MAKLSSLLEASIQVSVILVGPALIVACRLVGAAISIGTVTITVLENVELTYMWGKPMAGAVYVAVSPTRLLASTR